MLPGTSLTVELWVLCMW